VSQSDKLLPVGRFAGLFGLYGELKLDPTTSGEPLFEAYATFHAVLASGAERRLVIESARPHKGRLLVRLQGVSGATQAEIYVGAQLFAERERVTEVLDADEILDADLVGCDLMSPDGRKLGTVSSVEHYPQSAMLIVAPGKRYVPFLKVFLREVNIAEKRIVMDLPDGLLEGTAEIDTPE
jgi:16S rRNA processing protein RimM